MLAALCALKCGDSGEATRPSTASDAAQDTSELPPSDGGEADGPADSSKPGDAATANSDALVGPDGAFVSCPRTRDEIPGTRQACEYPRFCWEFRDHDFTKTSDCVNCRNIGSDDTEGGIHQGVYHLGGCWRSDTVGGCTEQTSGGPTVTFFYPESTCSDASVCTTQDLQNNCKPPRVYVPPGG